MTSYLVADQPAVKSLIALNATNLFTSDASLPGVETIQDRIRWILKARGFTQRGLATAAKLRSPSHIATFLATPGAGLSRSTSDALADAAQVPREWLWSGEGPPPDAVAKRKPPTGTRVVPEAGPPAGRLSTCEQPGTAPKSRSCSGAKSHLSPTLRAGKGAPSSGPWRPPTKKRRRRATKVLTTGRPTTK